MNVGIGNQREVTQFQFREYINRTFGTVWDAWIRGTYIHLHIIYIFFLYLTYMHIVQCTWKAALWLQHLTQRHICTLCWCRWFFETFVLIFNKYFLYWYFFSYRSLQGYERLWDLKDRRFLGGQQIIFLTILGQNSVCFRFFACK